MIAPFWCEKKKKVAPAIVRGKTVINPLNPDIKINFRFSFAVPLVFY